MMIVRTQKLPGDIELIGNGHRRDIHRYTAATDEKPHRLQSIIARARSHGGPKGRIARIAVAQIEKEFARG